MRIRLSDPVHIDELEASLRKAELASVRADDSTLVVLHPLASDENEARIELSFFVKAWRSRWPELQVELLG